LVNGNRLIRLKKDWAKLIEEVIRMNLLGYIKSTIMKDRSILISWLVSYVSILLIPIVITGFVFFESTKIVEKEINSNNAIMLKQIQRVIDKKMADIERLSIQIAWNPKLESIIYNSKPMNPHGRYVISQIKKDLLLCRIANGYIDEIYIYLHNSEMFVSSERSYSMDLLETVLADYEKLVLINSRSYLRRNIYIYLLF